MSDSAENLGKWAFLAFVALDLASTFMGIATHRAVEMNVLLQDYAANAFVVIGALLVIKLGAWFLFTWLVKRFTPAKPSHFAFLYGVLFTLGMGAFFLNLRFLSLG